MNRKNLLKTLALVACLLCSMSAAAQEAYACYTSDNYTLTFYYDSSRPNRTGTTYDLNLGNAAPDWFFDGTYLSVTNVVFKSSFSGARPTSTCGWFAGMENLTNSSFTGLNYLKTVNVTDMSYMFYECSELTNLDAVLSYLNTTNVTDMSFMFYGCASLTSIDMSNINTANVTKMGAMFANCYNLESINLSNFNTANVIDISALFYGCASLTSLDLSSFNTAKVTNMYNMFNDCASLTSLDLSSFNTAKVTDMGYMFNGCTALTSLDLSSFNTAKVTDMDNMFNGCSELVTVYAGDGWSTAAVINSSDMFKNCTNIKGSKGTTYNANYVDKTRAHIDGGTSNPGYFTAKVNFLRGDVNGDGQVRITDVTALINYLLSGDASGINLQAADCNMDGQVKITDVTALINYLLSHNW